MRALTSFLFLVPLSLLSTDDVAPSTGAIAAKLNGEPILAAEIETAFRLAYGNRSFSSTERSQLLRAALDLAIDRRLVLASLAKTGEAVSKEDVDSELSKLDNEFKAQGSSLAEHAEQMGLTPNDIRRSLAWKLSWQRYCEKQLTPQNLEKYINYSLSILHRVRYLGNGFFPVLANANDHGICVRLFEFLD